MTHFVFLKTFNITTIANFRRKSCRVLFNFDRKYQVENWSTSYLKNNTNLHGVHILNYAVVLYCTSSTMYLSRSVEVYVTRYIITDNTESAQFNISNGDVEWGAFAYHGIWESGQMLGVHSRPSDGDVKMTVPGAGLGRIHTPASLSSEQLNTHRKLREDLK